MTVPRKSFEYSFLALGVIDENDNLTTNFVLSINQH